MSKISIVWDERYLVILTVTQIFTLHHINILVNMVQ